MNTTFRTLLGSLGAAIAVAVGTAGPAVADATYPPTGPTTTSVEGTRVTRTPTSPSSTQLPFTGEPIAVYTVTGAALMVAGGLLTTIVRRQRRGRRTTA